jgi:hypothetical protein
MRKRKESLTLELAQPQKRNKRADERGIQNQGREIESTEKDHEVIHGNVDITEIGVDQIPRPGKEGLDRENALESEEIKIAPQEKDLTRREINIALLGDLGLAQTLARTTARGEKILIFSHIERDLFLSSLDKL